MIVQLAAGAVLTVAAAYGLPVWLARHCDLIWLGGLRSSVRVVAGRVIRSPRPVAGRPAAAGVARVIRGEIEGGRMER